MDPLTLAVVALAAALAGFVQGFAGFGSTLVALPLMGAVLDVRTAVPLGCLMALGLNLILGLRLHGQVQGRPLARILAASLPGLALGAVLLGTAPEPLLKALLGLVVLYVALRSLGRTRPGTAPGPAWTALAGLAAGCLGVCIGINGPPVVAWAARQPWSRDGLRATLAGYFLLAGLIITGVQAAQGLVTGPVGRLLAAALPALALGLWAGTRTSGRVTESSFRLAVRGLLAASAGLLLWQAAF